MPRFKYTPKRVTEELLEEFIKDEGKGKRDYKKYGFAREAADEARHEQFFKKLRRKMKKKK
jgi:hypothetical protein